MKKSNLLSYFKVESRNSKVSCPACHILVYKSQLNDHLDLTCLSSSPLSKRDLISNAQSSSDTNNLKLKASNCFDNVTSSKLNLKNQRKKKNIKIQLKNEVKSKNDSDEDIMILAEISPCCSKIMPPLSIEESNQNTKYECVNQAKNSSKTLESEKIEKKDVATYLEAECEDFTHEGKLNCTNLNLYSELVSENCALKKNVSIDPKRKFQKTLLQSKSLKRQATFLKVSEKSKIIKTKVSFKKEDKISSENSNVCSDTVSVEAVKSVIEKDNSLSPCLDIAEVKSEKAIEDVRKCLDDDVFSELSDNNEKEEVQKTYDPYYIANFKHILESVLSEEDNLILFNDEDMHFVNTFKSLSDASQKLYVRLFQRKYKWLRINKINYPDITNNTFETLEELAKAGLVDSGSSDIDLETAINLLSLPEAKSLAKHFNFSSSKSKAEIKSMLIKHSKQHKSVFFMNGQNGIANMMLKKVKKTIGPCYRLSLLPKRLFTRILMLFNLPLLSEDDDDAAAGGQQLQLLTLLQVNKGELTFPEYKRTKETVIFQDRDELIRYEEARQLENDIFSAVEYKKFEKAKELYIAALDEFEDQCKKSFIERAISLPIFLKRYTSFHVYIRCMTQGVEILQKLRQYKEAVVLLRKLLRQNIFCQDYKGRWYDRLALNLEQHLKKPEEALEAIKQSLQDKNVRVGHRYSLLTRALRITKSFDDEDELKKQLLREADVTEAPKVTIKGRLCPRSILGRRHVFISSSTVCSPEEEITVLGVEQLAIEHYKSEGYTEGIHGEGSTFISLYALLFWDIIYDGNVPDVFISPYQTHPLDLNSDAFFINRDKQIINQLETLKTSTSDELKEIVKVSWLNNHGKASLVSWDYFTDLEHIQGLVSCLGSNLLSGICERLARDFRFTRSGVPDLVVWNPESLQVKIVEVKGPGDKLSSKQILWLDYLIKLGADAEVCLVEAEASKKIKK